MKLFSHGKRPTHLGPYPLERLPRLADPSAEPLGLAGRSGEDLRRPAESEVDRPLSARHAYGSYLRMLDRERAGEAAPPAPVPDDPTERADNLKAGLYFLDADMVGCSVIPDEAWTGERRHHHRAVVSLVAQSRKVGAGWPGDDWIDGTRQVNADLRASELAVITASYLRNLGFDATAHTPTSSDIDLDRLALQAGLLELNPRALSARLPGALSARLPGALSARFPGALSARFPGALSARFPGALSARFPGALSAPYLRGGFSVSVVTTSMELTPDAPLARRDWRDRLRSSHGPAWWFGWGGTRAGIGRLNGDHRPLHLGRYPMERIKRVDEPTTLIIDDEVERVPVRAGGFPRAANGDMGPKFEADVKVFAFKTPSAQAYVKQIGAMVPHQDGDVAPEPAPGTDDPDANADALKALAYHLGGDMVGVCRVPDYAWYSHKGNGTPIEPYHRNAVVILLDQGYETMEGASGDDWISGAQSMRAYMRGAQIAGIMGEHVRSLGYGARSQTNRDSDVLHIPLVLLAGLGEMSRIGELVLNPFVGPRFKSVVLTTDMPLTPDRPIDFGLQDFCTKCTKCARECPCAAIPFGDKVVFNGYETWKPDVEKCTKYRLGNQKGSACGRCMKTCPYNIEGVLAERLFLWSAIKAPFTRRWIAQLDDRVGNGSINPIKKWWWDLEFVDGRTVEPRKGTNARELDMAGGRVASKQKIAHYTPDMLPPGDAIGVPVKLVRKDALERGAAAESPAAARARVGSGGGRPAGSPPRR